MPLLRCLCCFIARQALFPPEHSARKDPQPCRSKRDSRTEDQTEKLSILRKHASDRDAAVAALEMTIRKKNADLSSANDRLKELKPSLEQAIKEIGFSKLRSRLATREAETL